MVSSRNMGHQSKLYSAVGNDLQCDERPPLTQQQRAIIWTIAGSDSGGGAGIQADLHTIQALGAYGCSVITALTAQNSVVVNEVLATPAHMVRQQLLALAADLPAKAIKLGMLVNTDIIQVIAEFLSAYSGYVVCDPVMVSTSGHRLLAADAIPFFIKHLLPHIDLLTPNLPEAELLLKLQQPITTTTAMQQAAQELHALGGSAVLLKGGHGQGNYCQDYFYDGENGFWLTQHRVQNANNHGSGCTLSSAIAACIGQTYQLKDAVVIAKAYVSQGIRLAISYGQGPGPLQQLTWPMASRDMPWISATAESAMVDEPFLDRGQHPLGFYPIVPNCVWLTRVLKAGANTVQLRIKEQPNVIIEQEIQQAVQIAQQYQARLYINDHWQLAIKYKAYGVHLGQDDLTHCCRAQLLQAGLRLGISTHNYFEVAVAHAWQPTYIAIGPIFPTKSKPMQDAPQGLFALKRWVMSLNYPLVAIAGINLQNVEKVVDTGVDGIAVISAVTEAEDPESVIASFMACLTKM